MRSLEIFCVSSHPPSQIGRGPLDHCPSTSKRISVKQLSTTIAILLSTLAVSTTGSARDLTGANTHVEKASDSDPLLASVGRWDTDHDGIYTCAEWQAYMTRLFALADIHGSGFLDNKELADIAVREPLFRDASLKFFDSDGDGKISRFEFVGAPSPFFTEFDPEGSCKVTAADLHKGATKSPRSAKARTAKSAMGTGE